MKRFLLPIALVFAAGLVFTSCLKDDDYYGNYFYPNAIVTAKTSDAGEFYLQLDDETTLKPENMSKSPYGREVRALINFTDKGAWTGTAEDGLSFDRSVIVNAIDSVRTKDAVATLGDKNDEVYGTAPIDIITNSWYTVLEDDYLTLTFCAVWGNPYIYHEINLVTGTDPENPYLVELRHNPLEDNINFGGVKATGVIAFRLSDLIPGADHLDIKYPSFYGDRTVTIKRNTNYYTGDEVKTRSASDNVKTTLAVK